MATDPVLFSYLLSRKDRPLHLAVWVMGDRDRSGYAQGRHAPLCNQDYKRQWQYTGPWSKHWDDIKDNSMCTRCVDALNQLVREAKYVYPDYQSNRD